VYTEKVQETRGLLGSVGTDHVHGQISMQIQMKAGVFYFPLNILRSTWNTFKIGKSLGYCLVLAGVI